MYLWNLHNNLIFEPHQRLGWSLGVSVVRVSRTGDVSVAKWLLPASYSDIP